MAFKKKSPVDRFSVYLLALTSGQDDKTSESSSVSCLSLALVLHSPTWERPGPTLKAPLLWKPTDCLVCSSRTLAQLRDFFLGGGDVSLWRCTGSQAVAGAWWMIQQIQSWAGQRWVQQQQQQLQMCVCQPLLWSIVPFNCHAGNETDLIRVREDFR